MDGGLGLKSWGIAVEGPRDLEVKSLGLWLKVWWIGAGGLGIGVEGLGGLGLKGWGIRAGVGGSGLKGWGIGVAGLAN